MTRWSFVRVGVVGCALFLSAKAQAAACFEVVADAAVCGTTVVEDGALCGVEKVTDATECGTKKVSDAVACGTETVTDGAQCGWDTLTGVAKCGEKCVASMGANCVCKAAKSCTVPKRCRVAKTCDKPKSCSTPKTCTRRVAGCEPFPQAWQAQVVAAVTAKHQDHLAKMNKALAKAPDQAAMASMVSEHVKRLPETLGPYTPLIAAKTRRLAEVLNDDKQRALVQRIVLKAANREIDADLQRDVAELARALRVPEEENAKAPAAGKDTKGKKVVVMSPMGVDLANVGKKGTAEKPTRKDDDEDETEGRAVARQRPLALYKRVHVVAFNVAMGAGASVNISIGVAFDDDGKVKGFFAGGYSAGISGEIGANISYTMISEPTLTEADGVGIGLSADAAYYGGLAVGVSWAVPGSTPIPSWTVGAAAGVGAGAAYSYSTSFIFGP